MNIVFAGRGIVGERCLRILRSLHHDITILGNGWTPKYRLGPCDVLWSVHWPHKFTAENIADAKIAALNVHNSYLPWCRGADTPYWTLKERTPCGATVHWLDDGIDTGPICWQRYVEAFPDDTPEILYDRIANEEVWLFTMVTRRLLAGKPLGKEPQVGDGSFHRKADRREA